MKKQQQLSKDLKSVKGSLWHRWEPHIHTPNTVLNNQFKSKDIGDYCDLIEQSDPPIRALGVTDYYSLTSYEKLLEAKSQGRLANVELLFPNVELRFKTSTTTDKAINGHLIFSPEDPDHVTEIKRFLQKLTYSNGIERYSCQEADLIKLGKDHDKNIIADNKALETGTNQFKVEFDQLVLAIKESTWAQKNLLIAIASGKDGTSGLKDDASFANTRQAIERASHIIFTSNERDREFWLGKGVQSKQQILATYRSCKLCIHGSDAHTEAAVGKPLNDKYTWIKGDLNFEALVQACIEPEDRAHVGLMPPDNRLAPYIIDEIEISNSDWLTPNQIPLNSGLIAIIGARGSGKTALADLIATGGYAISEQQNDTSFIQRASEHLQDTEVTLKWQEGASTTQAVRNTHLEDIMDYPRVQYLSQKFVDLLCSSEGMTDRLILEIEKVIFHAHPKEDRLGVSDFQELLSQKAFTYRAERIDQEEMILNSSRQITIELEKKRSIPALEKKVQDLTTEIAGDKKSRDTLLSKDKDSRLKNLSSITTALDKVTVKLEKTQSRLRSLNGLKQTVTSSRTNTFPNFTTKLPSSHPDTGLSASDWLAFAVDFKGDVDKILSDHIAQATLEISKIKGTKPAADITRKPEDSYLTTGIQPEDHTYEILVVEAERLKKLTGIDAENAKQYTRISEKIQKSETELGKLNTELTDAQSATTRLTELSGNRKLAYKNVFKAILAEEEELKHLYQPLMSNLKSQSGSLGKLSFVVRRRADIEAWAQQGEDLLDLRKAGPFKGKGALYDAVKNELKNAWENGTDQQISDALALFRDKHENDILEHAQADKKDLAEYSKWANQIAGWLYSTDHITISYGVIYDNVDIQQLSPGTRGIVLLLLYLAIDQEDERPLIIDQPEENLDPKSIFDELVPLFKNAKNRRQIIIVTHNANLVVNTDADQVIIANAGQHDPGKLPAITYQSGGLENSDIRTQVCEILEGGEAAFKERAKRLRVAFS